MHLDCIFDGRIKVPPESYDIWIGLPPGVYQRLELIFGKPHFEGTHCLQCADTAAVAKSQIRNLTFLTKVTVDAMFLNRYMEHLTGTRTVNVTTIFEYLCTP